MSQIVSADPCSHRKLPVAPAEAEPLEVEATMMVAASGS